MSDGKYYWDITTDSYFDLPVFKQRCIEAGLPILCIQKGEARSNKRLIRTFCLRVVFDCRRPPKHLFPNNTIPDRLKLNSHTYLIRASQNGKSGEKPAKNWWNMESENNYDNHSNTPANTQANDLQPNLLPQKDTNPPVSSQTTTPESPTANDELPIQQFATSNTPLPSPQLTPSSLMNSIQQSLTTIQSDRSMGPQATAMRGILSTINPPEPINTSIEEVDGSPAATPQKPHKTSRTRSQRSPATQLTPSRNHTNKIQRVHNDSTPTDPISMEVGDEQPNTCKSLDTDFALVQQQPNHSKPNIMKFLNIMQNLGQKPI